MLPKISERASNLGTETAFVVSAEVKELERLKKLAFPIVKLHIGDPDFPTPKNILDAMKKAMDEGKTGYTPTAGLPEFKKAIADYTSRTRGIDVDPNHVVSSCGSKIFIMAAIHAAADYGRGHEVLFPDPGYPVYEAEAKDLGTIAVPYTLREKNGFRVDIKELESKINKKTRLLILNYPQNPTGGNLTKTDLGQIADIVLKYPDMFVLSDEIYSRILYEGDFTSIASIPGMQERTFLMDGASKTYAMTGSRLGWVSINHEKAIKKITDLATNIVACAPHYVQYGGIEALTGKQDAANKMLETYRERRDLIVKGLNNINGIKCKLPTGAFYAYPNITKFCQMVGVPDAEALRKELLYKAGVAVTADIHFGPKVKGEGEHHRFSYAASFDAINEGLRRIENYMAEHSK
jgi:aspartate/methionine/tyrosine aminotransferase